MSASFCFVKENTIESTAFFQRTLNCQKIQEIFVLVKRWRFLLKVLGSWKVLERLLNASIAVGPMRERERERKTDRQTERHTHRKTRTERERKRQTDRERDRERELLRISKGKSRSYTHTHTHTHRRVDKSTLKRESPKFNGKPHMELCTFRIKKEKSEWWSLLLFPFQLSSWNDGERWTCVTEIVKRKQMNICRIPHDNDEYKNICLR